jgi:hypothetical protein
VRRVQADWLSPLNIEGLEVLEGREGGGGGGGGGSEGAPARRLISIGRITTAGAVRGWSLGAEGWVARRGRGKATRRGPAVGGAAPHPHFPAPPATAPAEPMWALLGGSVTLTVAEPALDLSLSPDGITPRIVAHFQAARLLSALLPLPGPEAPGGVAAAATEQGGGAGAGALPEDGSVSSFGGAGDVAGAAGASVDDAPAGEPPTGDAGGGNLRIEPAAGGGRRLSALRRALTRADAATGFSLEIRGARGAAVVSEGRLLVPSVVREALGRHVHASVALGAPEVRALAEEMGDDDGTWVDADAGGAGGGDAAAAAARRDQGVKAHRGEKGAVEGGGGGIEALDGQQAGGEAPGGGREPLVVQVDSERLRLDARGWLEGGRCVLQRPIQARVELTPEFAT